MTSIFEVAKSSKIQHSLKIGNVLWYKNKSLSNKSLKYFHTLLKKVNEWFQNLLCIFTLQKMIISFILQKLTIFFTFNHFRHLHSSLMEENYCILQTKSLILFDELNLKCYLGCQFIFISSISSWELISPQQKLLDNCYTISNNNQL